MLKIGREYTNPRDAPRTERNGVTGANTRIGPIHDMLITEQYGRYSIEVKIDSQLLGLSSSRSVDSDDTELSVECTEPFYDDSGTVSTKRLVAFMKSRAQSSSSSSNKKG